MELTLSAELQAKLTRIAHERGTDPEALAREAIERLVDYDDWFVGRSRAAWHKSTVTTR
jgi:predicted transcriptional regulator